MATETDVIIIGGGHNGLVAALCLARAGKRVTLLEQRPVLGGAAATEPIWPGYRLNTGAEDAGLFSDELVAELQLSGLEFIEPPLSLFAPQPDGTALRLSRDIQQTAAQLALRNRADADRYAEFAGQVELVAGQLRQMMKRVPPDIMAMNLAEAREWGPVALRIRRLGRQNMMSFMRALPMPVKTYLDEWFDDDALKGALGSYGITGVRQGPRSAGTALMFFYQHAGGFLRTRYVRGGTGKLSAALADAAISIGADIRTSTPVQKLLLGYDDAGYHVKGVRLANGHELMADQVLSNADPRHTFFDLAGAAHLNPDFMRQVRNIRYLGSSARLLLAVSQLPEFRGQREDSDLTGHIRIAPHLDYLERAADDAKYGAFSRNPYLDIVIPTLSDPGLAPERQHVIAVTMQFAPYALRQGDWGSQREQLADRIVATLGSVAPELPGLVSRRHLITPLDYEQEYGLAEGSIHHGQMALDQLLVMRPVSGMGRYRTPVRGLYLCGSGAHPGGGVTGLPGYLAAKMLVAQ